MSTAVLPIPIDQVRSTTAPAVHEFRGDGGDPLRYRAWMPADGGRLERGVVLLHRGHEHSGRWSAVAPALVAPGTAVFAWDARGHGHSPGPRGDAAEFSVYVRDLDRFVRHLHGAHGLGSEDLALVAHSVGAVVAAAWVHDYAPALRALVLVTPAFRVKLYVPLAVPGLRLLERVRPGSFIKSYVGGKLLTHDRAEADAYDSDPLVSKQISVRVLLGLQDAARRLVADAGAIRVPTLVLAAGQDAVVRRAPQRRFFDRLSSPTKEFAILDGFSHAVFHEVGRAAAVARVRDFLERAWSLAPESPTGLLESDRRGHTKSEFDRLKAPLAPFSPRGISFSAQRLGMGTLCRLSQGVRLGLGTGFDSGESLDYVYENRARGTTPLGRMIDRQYLDAIGWRGIRQRRVHLERLLGEAIGRIHAAGRPVRVVDIAAGPGRYALETLRRLRDVSATARLRDRSLSGLAAGRALAREFGLEDRVIFETGEAFDEAELAALTPRPTVAVVSGLYELFPDNAPVRASLRGLHAALEDGGELVYTNQPWHPQVEMIARTLRNREGQPWVMRRRTQGEMDALVHAAGFTKFGMEIDPWGIFTVSVARKISRTGS